MTRKIEIATPELLNAYRSFYSRVGLEVSSLSVSVDDQLLIDSASGLILNSAERLTTKMRSSMDGAPSSDSKEEQRVERHAKIWQW